MPCPFRTAVASLIRCTWLTDIESAFRGDLLAALGHEAAVGGPHDTRDIEHLVGDGHLQVHVGLDEVADGTNVLHLDVATIFAQMQCDAVGAGHFGCESRVHGVGIAAAARLAQGGHVVDVDA